MAIKYDKIIASEIISQFGGRPEMLVQVLHALVERYGYISEEAIRQVATELNLSRAEVHGVVSFTMTSERHRRPNTYSRFARQRLARPWAAGN